MLLNPKRVKKLELIIDEKIGPKLDAPSNIAIDTNSNKPNFEYKTSQFLYNILALTKEELIKETKNEMKNFLIIYLKN